MADTCHECGQLIGVQSQILGVFHARKPSYGSHTTYWHEVYDGQIILLFHPECMQQMWQTKLGEKLPDPIPLGRG